MITGDYRLYVDGKELETSAQSILDCSKNGEIVDIMTVYSNVYVSAQYGEDLVTLHVPNFITIGEIKNVSFSFSPHVKAILKAVDYHVEEIVFTDRKLSDLDDTKSVFFYKLGSLTPPDDFEESDGESYVVPFSPANC